MTPTAPTTPPTPEERREELAPRLYFGSRAVLVSKFTCPACAGIHVTWEAVWRCASRSRDRTLKG